MVYYSPNHKKIKKKSLEEFIYIEFAHNLNKINYICKQLIKKNLFNAMSRRKPVFSENLAINSQYTKPNRMKYYQRQTTGISREILKQLKHNNIRSWFNIFYI